MIKYGKYAFFYAAAAVLAFQPSVLRAQSQLDGINWQVSRVAGKTKLPFETIRELNLAPYGKYPYKLRAVVAARNLSARPSDGLVLRCALSLHIVKLSDPADAGFWAVPFRVEELRISQINPGAVYEARLIHFALNEQLKKFNNTGFWVDALRLNVMLDPRQGDEPAKIMSESVIRISKP
jgi:hypothetical protein